MKYRFCIQEPDCMLVKVIGWIAAVSQSLSQIQQSYLLCNDKSTTSHLQSFKSLQDWASNTKWEVMEGEKSEDFKLFSHIDNI